MRTAVVPSNIALIKYWGKREGGRQWAANDSLSMTLTEAATKTSARLLDGPHDELWIDGQRVVGDAQSKALLHLVLLRQELGFATPLVIDSHNSFPSDCGVASSASGLGALTLAAIAAWTGARSLPDLQARGFDLSRLAHLARLGSGSACRSFFGGYVLWHSGGSEAFQRVDTVIARDEMPLADTIVLLSRDKKGVPSTVAHKSAWSSPLFRPRLAGLPDRLKTMTEALHAQDFTRLGEAIETEALEMHAVMMTSTPAATYLLPRTSDFIVWLREARRQGDFEAYFTLDAGPNPHVFSRVKDQALVADRIRTRFGAEDLILDCTGTGPTLCL